MQSSTLSISYTITRRDLLAANWYAIRSSPIVLAGIGVAYIYLIATTFPLIAGANMTTFQKIWLAGQTLIQLTFIVVLAATGLIVLSSFMFRSKTPGVLGHHTITITPEGLTEATYINQDMVRWGGVKRIAETAQHIFVVLESQGIHGIPKHAFPRDAAAATFIAQAREWHTRATD